MISAINHSGLPPGIVRASSVFPILSTTLLMLGGMCVGVGRVNSKTNNVLLSAGILFVAAGEMDDTVHAPSEKQSCGLEFLTKKAALCGSQDPTLYLIKGAVRKTNLIFP